MLGISYASEAIKPCNDDEMIFSHDTSSSIKRYTPDVMLIILTPLSSNFSKIFKITGSLKSA